MKRKEIYGTAAAIIAVAFLFSGLAGATSVAPGTMPTAVTTFAVGSEGGNFTAYGVTVYVPAGLDVSTSSGVVPVTSFSILHWATGATGPGPKNFPTGTEAVKAFGFEINGMYTFNPGSNSPVLFKLDGATYALKISVQTNGNEFFIWNPVTGAFTNVTAKTGYSTSVGLATAYVVSPIFAWVITTPVPAQAS
jgi:hypothetical protein